MIFSGARRRNWAYRFMATVFAVAVGFSLASGMGGNARAQSVVVQVPERISLLG